MQIAPTVRERPGIFRRDRLRPTKVHNLKMMTTKGLLRYAERLAERVIVADAEKTLMSQRQRKSREEGILATVLSGNGSVDYEKLAEIHKISKWTAIKIVRGLRNNGRLERQAPQYKRKEPLRVVDENYPLVKNYKKWVMWMADRQWWLNRDIDREDIRNEALRKLFRAAELYNERIPVSFAQYARIAIRRGIERFIKNERGKLVVKGGLKKLSISDRIPGTEDLSIEDKLGKEDRGIMLNLQVPEASKQLLQWHRDDALSENQVLTLLLTQLHSLNNREVGDALGGLTRERIRKIRDVAEKIAKRKQLGDRRYGVVGYTV